MPSPFTRFIGKAGDVVDRSTNDVEWDLELERTCCGIDIGQEERARRRVLEGSEKENASVV